MHLCLIVFEKKLVHVIWGTILPDKQINEISQFKTYFIIIFKLLNSFQKV